MEPRAPLRLPPRSGRPGRGHLLTRSSGPSQRRRPRCRDGVRRLLHQLQEDRRNLRGHLRRRGEDLASVPSPTPAQICPFLTPRGSLGGLITWSTRRPLLAPAFPSFYFFISFWLAWKLLASCFGCSNCSCSRFDSTTNITLRYIVIPSAGFCFRASVDEICLVRVRDACLVALQEEESLICFGPTHGGIRCNPRF